MPTVTLRFPSNMPGLPGHNWANGIAMATPIAHKGAVAGAKVQALTLLDLLLTPKLVTDAWDYFNNVQTKEQKYIPFITAADKPATFLNAEIMEKYRPLMRPYYYDPSKYDTYLRAARHHVSDRASEGDQPGRRGRAGGRSGRRGRPLIEACVTTLDEAVGAVQAGAHRLELCRDLDTGGLTPPPALLAAVRAAVDVPVFAMARTRPGPFVLEVHEVALLLADVTALRGAGADGIVMGALHHDGTVDGGTTRLCVEAAADLPVTFHRAFDEVADPLAALDVLIDLGVRRVLTAGGPGRARDHADRIAALVRHASDRIAILAGGGVRGDHVRHLVAFTGVREVHARASAIPGLSRALAAG